MTVRGSAAIVAIVLAPGLAAEQPSAASLKPLRVVFDRTLPDAVQWAFDVRWLDESTVVVAAGRAGLYEVTLSEPDLRPRLVAGSQKLEYAARLAISQSHLAAAAPFGLVEWTPRDTLAGWRAEVPMGAILDLDISGDRILLLGGRRVALTPGGPRVWAPEGGILFSGNLRRGLGALSRLMTAHSGIEGKAIEMGRCHILELGAVRFLSGERYVVLPGVQPGVFVYNAEDRLLRAWSTKPLGIYDHCDVGREEKERNSLDLTRRIAWWQSHTVSDDLVPWDDWFAILIREPQGRGAKWRLVPFGPDGAGAPLPLPVTGSSPGFHVRGDVRGDRMVLLLFDYEETDGTPKQPKNRPRLLVLKRGEG